MAQRIWTSEDLKELGLNTEPEVHRITGAEERQSIDVERRWKSYSLRMTIRVICVIAGVLTHGWVQIACFVGAAVLPWVAVVGANGVNRQPRADFSEYLPQEQVRMLEAAQNPSPANEKTDEEEPLIIDGTIVETSEEK